MTSTGILFITFICRLSTYTATTMAKYDLTKCSTDSTIWKSINKWIKLFEKKNKLKVNAYRAFFKTLTAELQYPSQKAILNQVFSLFSSFIIPWCVSIDITGNVTKNGSQHISKAPRIRPTVRKAFFSRLRLCNFFFIITNSSFRGNCVSYCDAWGVWRREFRFIVENTRFLSDRCFGFGWGGAAANEDPEWDVSSSGVFWKSKKQKIFISSMFLN